MSDEPVSEEERRRAYEQVRRESEALRNDPADQAELEAARKAMGADEMW